MLEDTFKRIADEAPSMLWISNEKKDFVFFNKAWLDFRGTTLEEEISESWMNAVYPHDLPRLQKTFDRSFQDRKPFKIEYRIKRHDGSYRWIIDSGRPQYNGSNRFMGYIGSCMEIHNIKELGKRKEDFITAASHELKTPLTSLTVFLHLIDEYFQQYGPESYQPYSEGAIIQLNKVTSLVEQLLDLNKIQTGSLSYQWSQFVVSNAVAAVLEKARLLYPGRIIHYKNQSTSLITGDYERLSQTVEILLNNAVKYSDQAKRIEVCVTDIRNDTIIEVLDYGIGIDIEYQTKIFERFFRIPGQREQTYPGMGMGLYLARKIVEKHNGKISVESKKNEYTRFTVRIPLNNK